VVAATSTGTLIVRIGRVNADASVSGDRRRDCKLHGNRDFGNWYHQFPDNRAYSLLVRASDGKDILQNVGGGRTFTSAAETITSDASGTSKPILQLNPASGSYAPRQVAVSGTAQRLH